MCFSRGLGGSGSVLLVFFIEEASSLKGGTTCRFLPWFVGGESKL